MEITRLIFALLPVYLTLNACVEEKTTDAAATNYRNKDIEGEWISQSISDGVHEKRLYFSFQDSQCRYFFPNFVGNYEIKNNDGFFLAKLKQQNDYYNSNNYNSNNYNVVWFHSCNCSTRC